MHGQGHGVPPINSGLIVVPATRCCFKAGTVYLCTGMVIFTVGMFGTAFVQARSL
jgi:hypothetical protein